ncbi:hypothetical protein Mgra_00003762 [Meloidogyne graminicola]|nr:hypothetical protein Mgra_00003762 [Meloidogyne graminicola]
MKLINLIILFISIFVSLIEGPTPEEINEWQRAQQSRGGQALYQLNNEEIETNFNADYIKQKHPIHPILITSQNIYGPLNTEDYIQENEQINNEENQGKRAFVWKYFRVENQPGDDKTYVFCKFCPHSYELRKNLTDSLKYHLNTKHKDDKRIDFNQLNKGKNKILQNYKQGESSNKPLKRIKTEQEREYERELGLKSPIYEYFLIRRDNKAYCLCYNEEGIECREEISFKNTHYSTNLKRHLESHPDANKEYSKIKNKTGEGLNINFNEQTMGE